MMCFNIYLISLKFGHMWNQSSLSSLWWQVAVREKVFFFFFLAWTFSVKAPLAVTTLKWVKTQVGIRGTTWRHPIITIIQFIRHTISKRLKRDYKKKSVAEAQPQMSPISGVSQQELLQSSEGASDYFCCDWLTCQQLSNHQQLQEKKEKNPLMWGSGLFVLRFDFCGSRCRRNATEGGIFNNLPRQTVWRHMLLKPGHIHLFQRFLWTPTVSLKMESCATVWVNRLPDPNVAVWLAKGRWMESPEERREASERQTP